MEGIPIHSLEECMVLDLLYATSPKAKIRSGEKSERWSEVLVGNKLCEVLASAIDPSRHLILAPGN